MASSRSSLSVFNKVFRRSQLQQQGVRIESDTSYNRQPEVSINHQPEVSIWPSTRRNSIIEENPFEDTARISTDNESIASERVGRHRASSGIVTPAPVIHPTADIASEYDPSRWDAITPVPLARLRNFNEKYESDTETDDGYQVAKIPTNRRSVIVDPEKLHVPGEEPVGFFKRQWKVFRATYYPEEEPVLVLPSPPNDEEKYSYLRTNRLPLYAFGVFSFLSLSAGMWLFVISYVAFYWFGVVVALLEVYLIISYVIALVGKDYDYDAHKKILEDYPIIPANAPTVDIYLPCCKEPLEILENTYKYVQALRYPADKLRVYVLDDGGLDTVKRLATSYGFNYISRDDKPRLKKAGNLRWAFARTTGDYFVIYDADFCPRPDFLLETIPQHLADDKAAIIQTPQFFRTLPEQSWVEQGAGAIQELFYRVVQVNRNRWGASICVGSNAVYRRAALAEVGGTAEIGFSEDVHTGFYALTRGWKVKYLPLCLACGICPDAPKAFFSQQMRWCMGSTTLLTNPDFWKSSLSMVQKLCYLSGMMYYSAMSLSIFVSPLPGILLLWVRPEFFKYYNLAFAIPSLIYSFVCFRLWAKASYTMNVQFIMVIQSYAYFTAVKDRLFGRALAWVPTGDAKAHKNHKYRNMRIMAWVWLLIIQGALISGVTYRIKHGLAWWNCIPLLVLDSFNFFLAHRFLFCSSKHS